MLAKLGCTYVIVGHSERRAMHAEDDAVVAQKAGVALEQGMTPIVCVGEGLEVREAGTHVEHCVAQVKGSLAGLSAARIAECVIAYEPVWAIGTGRVATPDDAQEVCAAIRATVAELASAEAAAGMRILYGGAVIAKNVGDIVGKDDADGALVGGATLRADEFASLSAIAAGGPLP